MDMNFNSGKVFCTKCGAANKAGYRFCVKCGTKLVTFVPKPQVEDEPDIPKVEPAKTEPQPEQPTFSVFDEAAPVEEPVKARLEPIESELQPTFSAFEEAASAVEPVKAEPEPVEPELQPTLSAFEETAPAVEPVKAEPEPEQPTFSAFEQAAPAEEPVKAEPQPEQPTFSAFEETSPQEESAKAAGFAWTNHAAFEAESTSEYTGFARSGFTGATTTTAAAGAFATAVEAVKNNKQIDVSDAETVMSLLEQGESSALAKGLPAWDIVPPQVVVRRKHRV